MEYVNEVINTKKMIPRSFRYKNKYFGIGTVVHFLNADFPDGIFDGGFITEKNEILNQEAECYYLFDEIKRNKSFIISYDNFLKLEIEIIKESPVDKNKKSTREIKNIKTNLNIVSIPILFFSLIFKDFYIIWILIILFLYIINRRLK